jgi:hypothetical protein
MDEGQRRGRDEVDQDEGGPLGIGITDEGADPQPERAGPGIQPGSVDPDRDDDLMDVNEPMGSDEVDAGI